ncbi:FATE-like protein [Camelus ferus]|nr:FATE-like protein [Camelus ferus]
MVPSQNTSCSLGFGASSVPSRDLGVWMLVNVLTSQMAHLQVITERLRALEDQDATWRHREALFFTMLVSVCIANLWLWMRQ